MIDISKEKLEELYWKQDLSQYEIAERFGVSQWTIRKKMADFNIPKRDLRQARSGKHNAQTGKPKSEKFKKHMSELMFANPSMGMLGKHHSKETRQIIAEKQKKRIIVKCDYCRVSLEKVPSTLTKLNFCSKQCMYSWRKKYTKKGKDNKSWKRLPVNCNYCGKEMLRQPNHIERNRYHFCNYECYALFLRSSSNPYNLGGKLSRGVDWSLNSELCKKKDNYACKLCGKSRNKDKVTLIAHHVIPYRICGHNELWNLVTLCVDCHSKQQKEDHKWNGVG